jgi:glycosyltransferase involved in cell wall biosynthesis
MATKVLHVIARMNVGGTAHYVSKLVEGIPETKLATGFVQGLEIEESSVGSLPMIRIRHLGRKISPLKDFRAWLELRKVIHEQMPEIVHTHTFKAGLIGRFIGGPHKRVHTFHGHLFEDQSFSKLEKKIIVLAEQFLALRTDLLISVGKRVGIELRDKGIGRNGDWESVAPGVTALPRIDKQLARNSLGLKSDVFLVGWMARVTEVKNPFLFVELAKRLPTINFAMAGGGNLLEQIKVQAPKNLSVIGWTDASKFWSAVDCAISTSDNEGMPVALIEAQLAGIPVIATDVGSNGEVVESEITGILTSKDLGQLVSSTKRLSENPSLRNSMAKAAKTHAEKRFKIEHMIEAHNTIYRRLLE